MLQNNPKLKSLIMSLWNALWGGGIANPITAIEQITYLLFIKRIDDIERKRTEEARLSEENYSSKFEGTYKPWIDESLYQPTPKMTESEKQKLAEKRTAALQPRPNEELRCRYFSNASMTAEEMLVHVRVYVFPFMKGLNDEESAFSKYMRDAVFVIRKPSLL